MTNDPTWVPGAAGSGFGSDHLPFGRSMHADGSSSVVVRVGEHALDVTQAVDDRSAALFASGRLEPFLAAGPAVWAEVREQIRTAVTHEDRADRLMPVLQPVADLRLGLPVDVPDYVDFYASLDHATNVGRMFRPDGDALLPNWRHLPVSYHGRSGTVVPSGTPVVRPLGQRRGTDGPTFGPSGSLDIEAELGFVVGVPSTQGAGVSTDAFTRHVFGVVGLNDWSARDIQAWEYVPLGPHLAKSFATSISAWLTPLSALEHARCPLPGQWPEPLPHLRIDEPGGYDIDVEVEVAGCVISHPPYRSMYWGPAQMLAHLTSNGASVRTGDLFGSGTISGDGPDQRGSLLELSWNGTEPWAGPDGPRSFLEDGDDVVLRYSAVGRYDRIQLGEVRARIEPARQ